ncbi:hypothetical protein [Anaerosacchariphilus polymeriproducens]|uniref:Uncharacterized protein n=1 Tax=Anaerosacchariphilus polymeriproducens TaxID=1812858 RepID=A0A371B028_9FIRM|nr:hypothetical protein [Anaerosacchariphilus polymeriproducens]RDU25185.1 hypothetical protein DWV06_00470 [Anaerosacchariphilus polymeriproducens]
MEGFPLSSQRNRFPCNDDIIRTRDSIIEEIRIDRNTGYVTISYGVMGDFNIIQMELVTLIVGNNTVIRDRSGFNMRLSDLREGMVVDAEFSSAMTFSIPPQARAYRITVVNRNAASNITEGRVLFIDFNNRFLYTGNSNNLLSQMRFVITNSTVILDRNGNPIHLRNIRPGQRVRVEHATFQTASIPPQTTAFVVQII